MEALRPRTINHRCARDSGEFLERVNEPPRLVTLQDLPQLYEQPPDPSSNSPRWQRERGLAKTDIATEPGPAAQCAPQENRPSSCG